MPRQANFRTTYYKSLGVQGKEVEATFASLLQTSVVESLSQLIHMTLEFGVPPAYRPTMWCLVGHVLPLVRDAEAEAAVRREKAIMLADILMAYRVCFGSDGDMAALVTFYITTIRPHLSDSSHNQALTWVMADPLVAPGVIQAIAQVLSDPMEHFWCSVSFLEHIDRGLSELMPEIDVAELYHISPLGLETIVFRICAAPLKAETS
ncbi:hypothetical protein ACHHYP_10083 [Achlya hypogyna]|uniref:Rab-GAP TBC domain-containing protein n=1 Tax=Achlya hypogyna TaxID=1202772 RepID=A0A1V9ZIB8_ACHHY|nr:hypothetical protein ACHHYP_10083 [Achlya hypogyna]